jgi:hypothetical protein
MYFIPVWLMWNLLPLYLLLSFNLYGFLVHRARLTTPVFFDKPTRDIVAKCQVIGTFQQAYVTYSYALYKV